MRNGKQWSTGIGWVAAVVLVGALTGCDTFHGWVVGQSSTEQLERYDKAMEYSGGPTDRANQVDWELRSRGEW